MLNICIIPARKGSKRIPNKNIIDFNGKPLIAWTIEAAIKSNCFDIIIVATDSKKIAEIATENGAIVPFMRTTNIDDYSTISEATISYLKEYIQKTGNNINMVVQTMANCPLRSENEIIKLINHYNKNNKTSIISGFKYNMFNPWWAHELKDNQHTLIFKDIKDKRSQDLPELICPSGAIWISDWNKLLKTNTFYSAGYKIIDIGWKRAVDIDNYEDMELAIIASKLL